MGVQEFLEKLAPFTNTHSGREKSIRFMQYFTSFLIPTLKSDSNSVKMKQILQKIDLLKSSMSMTRKVLRFGVEIPILINIIKRIKQHQKTSVKMIFIQTLSDFFGAMNYVFDHPLYFRKVGILTTWSDEKYSLWSWYSDMCWFMQIICEFMLHIVSLKDMQVELSSLKQKVLQLKTTSKTLETQNHGQIPT